MSKSMDIILFITNFLLALAQGCLLIRAVRKLKNNILDFGAIFELLYIVWFVPVVYDMLSGGKIFLYVYKIVRDYNIDASYSTLTYYNFVSTIIMGAFEIGYNWKRKKRRYEYVFDAEGSFSRRNYNIIQVALLIVWAFLATKSYLTYGGTVNSFLSVARKNGVYQSFYEKNIIVILPLLLFSNYVFSVIIQKKRFGIKLGIYLLIILLSVLPTGQRREMITDFLFAAVVVVLGFYNNKFNRASKAIASVDDQIEKKNKIRRRRRTLRNGILLIFLIAVVSIPLLWYQRSIATQIQNRGFYIAGSTGRGVLEVIFGSGATGFPTMLAVANYQAEHEVNFIFRNVLYFIESPIPRAILGDSKLESLTEFMQKTAYASGNLSLFYMGDIYFTFDLFGIIISFFVGYNISKYYNLFLCRKNLRFMFYSVILFSQIITLYKNGLAEFLIKIFLMGALFYISFKFISPSSDTWRSKR